MRHKRSKRSELEWRENRDGSHTLKMDGVRLLSLRAAPSKFWALTPHGALRWVLVRTSFPHDDLPGAKFAAESILRRDLVTAQKTTKHLLYLIDTMHCSCGLGKGPCKSDEITKKYV